MPSISAIPYNASRNALYKPELGEPAADFSTGWDIDWIAAELSRLAYYRFEQGDGPRLDATLTRSGFSKPEAFQFAAPRPQAIPTPTPARTALVALRRTQPGSFCDLAPGLRTNPIAF